MIFNLSKRKKIHVYLWGGLGNQLFIYATARRLSVVNDAQLVLDTVTGFVRDKKYRRVYELHYFHLFQDGISFRNTEDKLARFRRRILPFLERSKPLLKKKLIKEPQGQILSDLLHLRLRQSIFMEGYWQSYSYFADIQELLRDDLRFRKLPDQSLSELRQMIYETQDAVALHVRRKEYNTAVDKKYYNKAIKLITEKLPSSHIYCFTDDPVWCSQNICSSFQTNMTLISGKGLSAIADFQLMASCRHFIIANSSFSWWAAWIGSQKFKDSIVIMPGYGWWLSKSGNSPADWIRIN